MKKKLLITSVLSLIMCFSLICGATFALFTSESKVNIAVTSGTVSVTAQVTDGTLKTSTTLSDFTDSGNNDETVYFENGGAAFFDEQSVLNLSDMTPGDIAEFDIDISNESDVTIQYRVTVKVLGELASALTVSVKYYGEETAQTLSGVDATAWTTVKAGDDVSVNDVNITNDIEVTVSFPTGLEDYSNLQDKAASISFTVEAVQGNATVNDSVEVGTVEELASVFAVGGDVKLTQDLALDSYLTVAEGAEVSLDLNGKNLSASGDNNAAIINNGSIIINGTGEVKSEKSNAFRNFGTATVNGGKFISGASYGINNQGTMTINNAELNSVGGIYNLEASMIINDGDFYANDSGRHGLYSWNSNVTINGGTFYQAGNTSNLYLAGDSEMTIKGGTFTVNDGYYLIDFYGEPTLNVVGGNLTGMIRFIGSGTTNISGGNLNFLSGTYVGNTHIMNITGGVFNTFDPTNYLADGYTATANEDGTYTVTVKSINN